MKKSIIFLFSLLLLIGCQPTPEQEFIVSKGDDIVELKLNATPTPDGAPDEDAKSSVSRPAFPARWDEDPILENERLILRVHTDLHTRADGLYPVYRTRASEISKETIENIAIKFLDKPAESSDALLTKEDWGRILQAFLDERALHDEWVKAGRPKDWTGVDEGDWSPAQIEETTNWYMEQIRNAPDSLTAQSVNDYSGLQQGKEKAFTLASGEAAWILWFKDTYIIAKGCMSDPNIYDYATYQDDLRLQEGNYKQWIETDLSREQAEATALRELERLGYTGYAVAEAEPATLLDITGASARGVAGGWQLVLRRDYGGYPQLARDVYASHNLNYGSGDGFVTNRPIDREQFRLIVSADGVRYLDYSGPKDISGLVNANVELLTFDEIKQHIANAMEMCFPYDLYGSDSADSSVPSEVEIYDLYLTTFTLRAKDSEDYYEMPCWVVIYDIMNSEKFPWLTKESLLESRTERGHGECLIINAVDGSIVHEDMGF